MDVLIALAMVAPMVAAAVAGIGGWRRWTATLTVLSCVAVLGAGVALAILTHGSSRIAFGDVLRADALSATMLIVVGVVGTLASWASIGYIDHELAHGHTDDREARRYGALIPAFVAVMALAVSANNIGVIWVAVEATTVIAAFLVGHRRTSTALEASWKYAVIWTAFMCSAGGGQKPARPAKPVRPRPQ